MRPSFRSRPLRHMFLVLAVPAAVLPGPAVFAGAVTAPYVNDFTAGVEDFVAAPAARWTHLPALGVYSNEFRSATTTAGVGIGNMGGAAAGAKPFTYVADFTFLDGNGTASYVGACFLSKAADLPATGGYTFKQVIATPSGTGIPLFLARNNVIVTNGTSFMQLRHVKGTFLRFEIHGVYVDTDDDGRNDALDIVAKIVNPATGAVAALVYRDHEPLTGGFFGMKTYDANNVTSAVNWRSFSVSDNTARMLRLIVR